MLKVLSHSAWSFKRLKPHIWTGVFLICLLYLKYLLIVWSVESSRTTEMLTSEKVHEETRFPPKPHWRDLGFAGEPKIKLPNQNLAQNSRLWCQHKLWIETLQRFFCCPRIQHDTATSSCVNVEDGEILWLREDGSSWGTPLGLRTRSTIWDPYKNQPFQRHQKSCDFQVLRFFQQIASQCPSTHRTWLKTSKQVEQFNVDFHWRGEAKFQRNLPALRIQISRPRIYKYHCWIGVLDERLANKGVLPP